MRPIIHLLEYLKLQRGTPIRISKITEGKLTVPSTIKYVNPLKLSSSAGEHVI